MKGLRLGREKTGSSVGKKKRVDKLIKQKNKEEKNIQDEGEEYAKNAMHFVDTLCESFDEKLPFLSEKLLGCGVSIHLGQSTPDLSGLETASNERWYVVGTLPPRRSNKLSSAEHQQLLDSVDGKVGVCGVLTGVEYGKPPHGENKPCADPEDQRASFEIHCKAALKWKVPIVLVIRPEAREQEDSDRAVADAITWLSECGVPQDYKIMLSSWLGTPKAALLLLKRFPNAVLGLNGAVTFRSANHLREIAFDVPLNRLVLQSDAPNAPPTNLVIPHSPWTILTIAACVAEQKRSDTETILEAANQNATTFFGKVLRTIEVTDGEHPLGEASNARKGKGGKPGKKGSSSKAQEDREEAEPSADEVDDTQNGVEDEDDLEELKKFLE